LHNLKYQVLLVLEISCICNILASDTVSPHLEVLGVDKGWGACVTTTLQTAVANTSEVTAVGRKYDLSGMARQCAQSLILDSCVPLG
jgi:hypothetical protein